MVQLDPIVLLDQPSPRKSDVRVAFLRVSVNSAALFLELLKSRVHVMDAEVSPADRRTSAPDPGRPAPRSRTLCSRSTWC